MITCNSFADNTVMTTQQTAFCFTPLYGLTDQGLPYTQTLLLILDMLERLDIGPAISAAVPCDVEEAYRAATCAVLPITSPTEDDQKLEALIFYKMNEALCA